MSDYAPEDELTPGEAGIDGPQATGKNGPHTTWGKASAVSLALGVICLLLLRFGRFG